MRSYPATCLLSTLAACAALVLPLALGISVPTGKLTPISPARSYHPTSSPRPLRTPAPVVEYTVEHPEPPPLNPSYVPVAYKYLTALSGNSLFYVPLRIHNVHSYNGALEVLQLPRKFYAKDSYRPPLTDVDYAFPPKYQPSKSSANKDFYSKPARFAYPSRAYSAAFVGKESEGSQQREWGLDNSAKGYKKGSDNFFIYNKDADDSTYNEDPVVTSTFNKDTDDPISYSKDSDDFSRYNKGSDDSSTYSGSPVVVSSIYKVSDFDKDSKSSDDPNSSNIGSDDFTSYTDSSDGSSTYNKGSNGSTSYTKGSDDSPYYNKGVDDFSSYNKGSDSGKPFGAKLQVMSPTKGGLPKKVISSGTAQGKYYYYVKHN